MAQSSYLEGLTYKSGTQDNVRETKGGIPLYSGEPYAFEKWKLRVMTKFNAVSQEADEKQKSFKLGELGAKILDGLSADALRIAMDMGSEALTKPDGVPVLVDKVEKSIMGQREDEARELHRIGARLGGPISRQAGERMTNYTQRRRRWYQRIQILDSKTVISENLKSDYLLMNAGLSGDQEVFVKTAVGRDFTYDAVEAELVRLYGRIHEREHRSRDRATDRSSQYGYKANTASRRFTDSRRHGGNHSSKGFRPKHTRHEPNHHRAYMAEADSDDASITDQNESSSSEEEHQKQEAISPEPHHENEYLDAEDKIEQDVCSAFVAVGLDLDNKEIAQQAADCVHDEIHAYYSREEARNRGVPVSKNIHQFRPRGLELTLQQRRDNVAKAKKNSKCNSCHKYGHWAGDPECENHKGKQSGQQGHGHHVQHKSQSSRPPQKKPSGGHRYGMMSVTLPSSSDSDSSDLKCQEKEPELKSCLKSPTPEPEHDTIAFRWVPSEGNTADPASRGDTRAIMCFMCKPYRWRKEGVAYCTSCHRMTCEKHLQVDGTCIGCAVIKPALAELQAGPSAGTPAGFGIATTSSPRVQDLVNYYDAQTVANTCKSHEKESTFHDEQPSPSAASCRKYVVIAESSSVDESQDGVSSSQDEDTVQDDSFAFMAKEDDAGMDEDLASSADEFELVTTRPPPRVFQATSFKEDMKAPAADTIFTFGRFRGKSFMKVTSEHPDYYFWGITQKCPSVQLNAYLGWVENCFEVNFDAKTLTEREKSAGYGHEYSGTSGSSTFASSSSASKNKSTTARMRELLHEKEPCQKCTRFTRAGTNGFMEVLTCLDCGAQTKTPRAGQQKTGYKNDPATCEHTRISFAKSSKTTHRTTCADCGTVLDEEPQESWKARKDKESGRERLVTPLPVTRDGPDLDASQTTHVVKVLPGWSKSILEATTI